MPGGGGHGYSGVPVSQTALPTEPVGSLAMLGGGDSFFSKSLPVPSQNPLRDEVFRYVRRALFNVVHAEAFHGSEPFCGDDVNSMIDVASIHLLRYAASSPLDPDEIWRQQQAYEQRKRTEVVAEYLRELQQRFGGGESSSEMEGDLLDHCDCMEAGCSRWAPPESFCADGCHHLFEPEVAMTDDDDEIHQKREAFLYEKGKSAREARVQAAAHGVPFWGAPLSRLFQQTDK